MRRVVLAVAILGSAIWVAGCTSKRDESNDLMNQALSAAGTNNYQLAKSKLQLAINADPTNAAAYHNLGVIHAKEGQPREAIPRFEKGVELEPNNAAWRFELAGMYWSIYNDSQETGRDEYLPKVEEHVSKAIDVAGEVAEYYRLRADCRKAMFSFKGAAQDYRKAIDLDPLEVSAYLKLGRLYGLMWKIFYREDLFTLAEQTLAAAAKLGELQELAAEGQALLSHMTFELGQLYVWRGTVEAEETKARDYREKAIAAFQSIEEDFPEKAPLKLQLAQVFKMNGDINKACTAAGEAAQGISGADPAQAALRNYVINLQQEVCVTSTGYDPNR